jgi:hypothetical protein
MILQQWKDNVIRVMMHYIDCVAENSWPLNETSCDKFNRMCEYYDVCDSSGQESKDFKLEMNYTLTTPWDVTKVLRKTSEQMEELKDKSTVLGDK